MTTTFIHVVGEQGIGKSTLILDMAARYTAAGYACAGQHPDIFTSRQEALEAVPDAKVYFIEHQEESTLDALPGELVIRLQRAGAAGGGNAPEPTWDGEPRLREWIAEAHELQALNAART